MTTTTQDRSLTVDLLGSKVQMKCSDEEIVTELRRIFCMCLAPDSELPDFVIYVLPYVTSERSCYLLCNIFKQVVVERRQNLYPYLKAALKTVFLQGGNRLIFHGAGVTIGGHGVIFPGDSGCGKSTITLALLKQGEGTKLLSDDILAVDLSKSLVTACKVGISLRPQTLELFPELKAALYQSPIMENMWVLDPQDAWGSAFGDVSPITHLFLLDNKIRGEVNSEPSLVPISPDEAAWKMITLSINGAYFYAEQNVTAQLVKAIQRCHCYRLKMGSIQASTRLVRETVMQMG